MPKHSIIADQSSEDIWDVKGNLFTFPDSNCMKITQ